ncbi:hypothetical protein [Geoalkalibacter subterraneus]|uniref:Uncharacterized protein n=1 Tax=Geoalkalibacter subterraneus TaxID=483547 RepID=A0A0B5FL89_9BACT|nr:hypothetical protein [Geoalkalibacter subterraneus]AJF08168.1 hypothetical protein GSUB_16840 [Geoalkalibacter subterraneus]
MALEARHENGVLFSRYGGVQELEDGFYGVIETEKESVNFGPYSTKVEASRAALGEIRAVAKWCRGYSLVR